MQINNNAFDKFNLNLNVVKRLRLNISVKATYKAKNDCPVGYVICEPQRTGHFKPLKLIDTKLTFQQARIHCKNLSSTICEFQKLSLVTRSYFFLVYFLSFSN